MGTRGGEGSRERGCLTPAACRHFETQPCIFYGNSECWRRVNMVFILINVFPACNALRAHSFSRETVLISKNIRAPSTPDHPTPTSKRLLWKELFSRVFYLFWCFPFFLLFFLLILWAFFFFFFFFFPAAAKSFPLPLSPERV